MRKLIQTWTKKDFKVDTFRCGGKGGQHQNKTDSGVRITHMESGLSAECRETRSQDMNKKTAFRKLVQLMRDHYYPRIQKERAPVTERIRTYHEPRGVVKDHRTGLEYNYEKVMNGHELEQVIADVIRFHNK
jgi:peptide chain release factor 1